MDNRHCQCEHNAHFERDWLTPNGNPGHKADAMFHVQAMHTVKTPYGKFLVCWDCRQDCLQDHPEVGV